MMKMSQNAAADSLGVSQQAIANWESGESIPRVPALLDACMVYGVSPNYLLLADSMPLRQDGSASDGPVRSTLARASAISPAGVPG